jgi:hypothetical protein
VPGVGRSGRRGTRVSQQYLRQLSLVLADPAGKGLDFGALRVTFEIHRGDLLTPNSCDIKIYNLSDATASTIDTEFTQLLLKVGYEGQALQQIFYGSIKQVRKGREDQRNSYVAITAADGDTALNFSCLALTLAAGSTPANAVEALIKQMATAANSSPTTDTGGQTVSQGYTPALSSNQSARGRVYYGLCKDHLRNFAAASGCNATIQDGQVHLIPLNSFIPGAVVLVTPATGLIGVPEQTQNGLEMSVLLNPNIKIGQLVQLKSADVNQYRYGLDLHSTQINSLLAESTAKLNSQGLYYVMRAEHSGDTRGNAWYSKLTCLAVDATYTNAQQATQATIAPPFPSPRDAILPY